MEVSKLKEEKTKRAKKRRERTKTRKKGDSHGLEADRDTNSAMKNSAVGNVLCV